MYKIVLREYGPPRNIDELAESCQTTPQNMRALFRKANARIMKETSQSNPPFLMDSDVVRVANIAGTIRLSAQVELEVIPKYLGFSEEDVHWKEDFYLLSTLSRHGRLFEGDNIHTVSAFRSTLYDIAGRALAENFISLRRHMLRKYRQDQFCDYSIEGEIRFEDAFFRQPDGIPQVKVKFDKKNEYNATILAAMRHLQPHITDVKVQHILQESITVLQPQNPVCLDRPRLLLPSRDLRWKCEYDLAYDIIHGMGPVFSDGSILSPGFIVNTWQIWEWLLTIAVRIGETSLKVASQQPFPFGTVKNQDSPARQQLYVYPDVSAIQPETGEVVYLVDAKYKLLSFGNRDANRADLYEAQAFCVASGCRYLFLAYPSDATSQEEGSVTLVASYQIEENTIFTIQVPVHGLARSGGLRSFATMLTTGINGILQSHQSVQTR